PGCRRPSTVPERAMIRAYVRKPGEGFDLDRVDTDETGGLSEGSKVESLRADQLDRLLELQSRFAAQADRALLIVLQGLDASGKDGTIRHVFSGVNPQGCRVDSFKAPTTAELAQDYLW